MERESGGYDGSAVVLDNPLSLARHLYRQGSDSNLLNRGERLDQSFQSDLEKGEYNYNMQGELEPDCYSGDKGDCLPVLKNTKQWDKQDGRLHPEYPLYCVGMPKPLLRGVLHLICTGMLIYIYRPVPLLLLMYIVYCRLKDTIIQ